MNTLAAILFLVFCASIITLFFKSLRRAAKISAAISLIAFLVVAVLSGGQENEKAKAAGFLDAADMRAANELGVTDATIWQAQRAQAAMLKQKAVAERLAAEKAKEVAETARRLELLKAPAEQIAFVQAVEKARQQYDSGGNDLQKGAARPARAKALCAAMKTPRIASWVGTLDTVTTNSDGKGVIHISIAKDLTLGTWNNSISDTGSNTLIEPDSELYQSLLGLKKGQYVRASGTLFSSSSDCYRETSLTMAGSLSDPVFLMKFSRVEPIDLGAK